MSRESAHVLDPLEVDAFIRPSLARYRPILPNAALEHFRRVATFLVEAHPASFRWLVRLRDAGPSAAAIAAPTFHADQPISHEMLASLAEAIGLPVPARPPEDHTGVVLSHGAEAGLAFLVEASFPEYKAPDEQRRAVGRFVDLTFASLFAGLIGALIRLHERSPGEDYAKTAGKFVWAFVLFRRFELGERHNKTFHWYFARPIPARPVVVAKHLKRSVAAETGNVFHFLDDLAAFVANEGPRLVSEIKTNPTELTRASRSWAFTLLGQELKEPRLSKRRRGS
jgi:hypothetical protein